MMKCKLIAAIAAMTFTQVAVAGPYTNLYVFGDSLVDAGNTQIALVGSGESDPAPATEGYFNGRFTNGPDYVDLLNQQMFGSYTRPSLAGGNNFAFGGALARNNGDPIPDLRLQVNSYFARSGGTADANALYIINVGGNDLFSAAVNPSLLPTFKADSIDVITAQVRALNAAGARNILVTGMPNIGGSAGYAAFPVIAARGRALSVNFNAILQSELDDLTLEVGTRLFRFDYINFSDNVIANLSANGLPTDLILDKPCTVGEPTSPTPDCTRYAFFDFVHPEARLQKLAFDKIASITGVPEPISLSLLGLGMIGLGVSRRRSRR